MATSTALLDADKEDAIILVAQFLRDTVLGLGQEGLWL